MPRYDFTPEYVGPGLAQQVAGATGNLIEQERQRRREKQQQDNVDRNFNQGVKEFDANMGQRQTEFNASELHNNRSDSERGWSSAAPAAAPAMAMPGEEEQYGVAPEEGMIQMPRPSSATSSGMPASTPTGDAPTAREVGLGSYNYRASREAQQLEFSNALEMARETRIHDRNRGEQLTDYDRDIKREDFVDQREFGQQGQVDQRRHQNDISMEGLRHRNNVSERNSTPTNPDVVLDRNLDNTAARLRAATATLEGLQKQMAPADPEAHAAQVSAAQAEVATLQGYMQDYQGAQDERTSKILGRPVGSSKPVQPKTPTPEQTVKAMYDPQYRQYLKDQGYTVQPPSSRATRGPMYGGAPLKMGPGGK